MEVKNKRFHYREFSRCIEDDLTGFLYSDLREITDLLNKENDARNRNAEKYISELMKNEKYRIVMKKYGIDSVEKLDQVLFNERVW